MILFFHNRMITYEVENKLIRTLRRTKAPCFHSQVRKRAAHVLLPLSDFRSHYLGKFSHLTLEIRFISTTFISLRSFPRLLRHHNKHSGSYHTSNQEQKSSIFKFSVTDVSKLTNFSLLLLLNKILYRDAPTREANRFLVHMPFSFTLPLSNTFY